MLDIQMPGRDGLALAREVRREDRGLPIVFVTGYSDHMGEGYEVAALHYLLKPVDEEKLFSCLDRALGAKEREQPLLLQDEEGQTRRVYQRDIKLLEASLHWVEFFHTGGSFRVKTSFQALMELLNPALFVRCHRSYVVGLRHMAKLGKAALTLDDGTQVPVSRRLFPQVSRAFVHYYRGEDTL